MDVRQNNDEGTSFIRHSGGGSPVILSPTSPLTSSSLTDVATSSKRWIMLAIFCCLAFLQMSLFVEWNPIANSALKVFAPDWTDSTLAWQINLATFPSPFIQLPIWLGIARFNLGRTLVWGASFPLLLSACLSSLPLLVTATPSSATYKRFTYAAFFFSGITGAVFFSSITRFSRLWFPPEYRATSTGLACTFASMGTLMPALLGPLMIGEPDQKVISHESREKLLTEISWYMFTFLVCCGILFLLFLICFSSSASGELEVIDFRPNEVYKKIFKLLKMPSAMQVMILQSLGTIPSIWGQTLLTVTLSPLGITQKSVSILIIVTTLISFVMTILTSRLADLFFRYRLKTLIVILLSLHALSMIGLGACCLLNKPTRPSPYLIFFCYSFGISVWSSCAPLMYELVAEMVHPVTEDIASGLCNQLINVVIIVFYLIFSFMSSSNDDSDVKSKSKYDWLIYTLMVVPVCVAICFIFVKESYRRSEAISHFSPDIVYSSPDHPGASTAN